MAVSAAFPRLRAEVSMRRFLSAVVLGLSLWVGGCGSGGGGVGLAALQQAFQQCSQTSLFHFLRLVNGAGAVLAVTQGQFPPPNTGVNITPGAAPNSFDFVVSLDINANGAFDTFLVGTATFSEDPTDGLLPGSSVTLVYDIRNTPQVSGDPTETGTLTGNVDVTVTFVGPEQGSLEGLVVLNDSAGGCSATLDFPQATPLQLVFPEPILTGPIPAANVGGIELFGEVVASLTALGQTLESTITLEGGSQEVTVVGFAGSLELDIAFDLFPPPEVIAPLVQCTEEILDLAGEIVNIFSEIAELDLADLVAGNIPGVTLTPTANPTVFNYSINLGAFGESSLGGGTLSGQATLTFAGLAVTRISVTWTLAAEGMLQGVTTITGQNDPGRPLVLDLDAQGDVSSLHGAGSFTTLECTGGFDVPSNAPITNDAGSVLLDVATGGNVLLATFVVSAFTETFTNVSINGIPVPADLFLQFLFFGDAR